jgi:hypothetical protein
MLLCKKMDKVNCRHALRLIRLLRVEVSNLILLPGAEVMGKVVVRQALRHNRLLRVVMGKVVVRQAPRMIRLLRVVILFH